MNKKSNKLFLVLAIVLLIISLKCLFDGFNYKNEYINSEDYPSMNVNAYVGGDAYNYIINGTYFTGYMVLGGSSGIASVLLFCLSKKISMYNEIVDVLNNGKAETQTNVGNDTTENGEFVENSDNTKV